MERQAERKYTTQAAAQTNSRIKSMMRNETTYADTTLKSGFEQQFLTANDQYAVKALANKIKRTNNGTTLIRAKEYLLSIFNLDKGWRTMKKLEVMMKENDSVALYCIRNSVLANIGPKHHKRKIAHAAVECSVRAARFALDNYDVATISTSKGWAVAHTIARSHPRLHPMVLSNKKISAIATNRGDTVLAVALYYRKMLRSKYIMNDDKEVANALRASKCAA